MKSKIRVDVDYDNQPIVLIQQRGNSYYSDQDLRDKFLAKFLDNAQFFRAVSTSGGEDSSGGYSEYEMRPVSNGQVFGASFDKADPESAKAWSTAMSDATLIINRPVGSDARRKIYELMEEFAIRVGYIVRADYATESMKMVTTDSSGVLSTQETNGGSNYRKA